MSFPTESCEKLFLYNEEVCVIHIKNRKSKQKYEHNK